MVSDLETFTNTGCNIAAQKSLFFADFPLQSTAETTLPDGLEASGQRAYCTFWHICIGFEF